MFKMLIVDDEPLVRLALQQMIDWEREGIVIAGEASDGREALELLRQQGDIDILLADMMMPRLDGVGLLRALSEDKELSGRIVPIILSAHNDYSFVREAFLLGALDYIVKADMEEAAILSVVRKAVSALEERRGAAIDMEAGADDVGVTGGVIRSRDERWLKELLTKEAAEFSDAAVASLGEELAKEWKGHAGVAVLKLAASSREESVHSFIRGAIDSVMKEAELPLALCRTERHEYALLSGWGWGVSGACSLSALHDRMHTVLGLIMTRMQKYMNVPVSIGVSDPGHRNRSWKYLYEQAHDMAEECYYAGFGHIFYAGASRTGSRLPLQSCEGDEDMTRLRAAIMHELKGASEADDGLGVEQSDRSARAGWLRLVDCGDRLSPLETAWEELCRLLNDPAQRSPQDVKRFWGDLLWELGSMLYMRDKRWEDIDGAGGGPHEALHSCDTFADTKEMIWSLLMRVKQLLSPYHSGQDAPPVYSAPVAQAKQFVDENFCEDVNLSLLSSIVGVSESYLSKQFAKEVGSNFIQYLTRLRMEEAKRLLQNDVKIVEVAERIGYWNPEHFSRLFKKMTGITPKDFKKKSTARLAGG
ncbi:response regulator transcription factor [Paenibacillus chungangensis]|uniref:Helix-turn-helix domain-containing protein n=1 Tax=Paenibacillus chungangensis TaxID=696535 RepID=A0ABW3HT83_9BACL